MCVWNRQVDGAEAEAAGEASDVVESFQLDADFDYDNVTLTVRST